jgi:hypothetical protein
MVAAAPADAAVAAAENDHFILLHEHLEVGLSIDHLGCFKLATLTLRNILFTIEK